MEAATIETKASNDQAWNAVNHSFIYRTESSFSRLVHPLRYLHTFKNGHFS